MDKHHELSREATTDLKVLASDIRAETVALAKSMNHYVATVGSKLQLAQQELATRKLGFAEWCQAEAGITIQHARRIIKAYNAQRLLIDSQEGGKGTRAFPCATQEHPPTRRARKSGGQSAATLARALPEARPLSDRLQDDTRRAAGAAAATEARSARGST